MVGLVFCIIALLIVGSMETTKTENATKYAKSLYDNTNMWREQELFHDFICHRKRLDGSPIPKDYSYISIWNEVDKQLRREGLRLSPSTCNLSKYKFDKNGYVINQYKKRG